MSGAEQSGMSVGGDCPGLTEVQQWCLCPGLLVVEAISQSRAQLLTQIRLILTVVSDLLMTVVVWLTCCDRFVTGSLMTVVL